MKSLYGLLILVLIAGSVFADVPSERKLPLSPPNNPSIDQVEPGKPVNDQPERSIMPVIYPDYGLILPPPVEKPGVRVGGPGYALDDHNVLGPEIAMDNHNQKSPIAVLDEEPSYSPPRSILPVEPRGIDDPMPGPRYEFPVPGPIKSPARSRYGIADDVPGPRHYPMPPPNNNILERPKVDRPASDRPGPKMIMPVIFPKNDYNPQPPVDRPRFGPNRPPQYTGDPDEIGSDGPLYLGVEERGVRTGLDMTNPGPWIPNPVFRNRIAINFGPNANRLPVVGRLFDMNGRLVHSEQARAGSTVVFSGARLASLSAGNYILQLDCGDQPKYLMKVQKAE